MAKLAHRTVVGHRSADQIAGVFSHPTVQMCALYSADAASSTATFVAYCQDQFEHTQPQTTLEFHQLLQRCIATAERMQVQLSLVSVGMFSERVVLAAYQGSIWLKRGQKAGQIVTAEQQLQLLEGNVVEDDVYVLLTAAAQPLAELLGTELGKLAPAQAMTLLDAQQLSAQVDGAEREAEMGVTVIRVTSDEASSTAAAVTEAEPIAPPVAPEPPSTAPAKLISQAQQFLAMFPTMVNPADVYVRRRQKKTLGRVLIFAVVLLFAIVGAFAFFRSKQAEEQRQVQTILQPMTDKWQQIQQTASQNPVAARQQMGELIAELEVQAQLKNRPAAVTRAFAEELEKFRRYEESISGQEALPALPIFFDLRLVQSNFLASALDVSADTLFFLDSGQKKILALTIDKKQPTVLPIGEASEIRAMITDDKYLYFLGQGLFRFTLSGTDVAKLVENPDETIKNGNTIGLFGSYVYVLNKAQNNIFRYTTNDDQLSSKPTTWIQTGQGTDLAPVQSLSIDADIWLGTQTGQIIKLTSGKQVEFSVTGLKEPLSTPVTVFTKPDLLNLYVLEPAKNRLVVLNKKGEFLKEVQSQTFAGSTSVVASEKAGKAFVLSGSLVYEVGL